MHERWVNIAVVAATRSMAGAPGIAGECPERMGSPELIRSPNHVRLPQHMESMGPVGSLDYMPKVAGARGPPTVQGGAGPVDDRNP